MAAVRGGVEQRIGRATLKAAIEDGLERFVARLVLVEAQIVTKDDEAGVFAGDPAHQDRQAFNVLAIDLDEDQPLEAGLAKAVDMGMQRLDQRALAHAAGAPQQGVVGAMPTSEMQRVLQQRFGDVVDAAQQFDRDAGDRRHRPQHGFAGVPVIGIRRAQGGRGDHPRGREGRQALGDTVQRGRDFGEGIHVGHGEISGKSHAAPALGLALQSRGCASIVRAIL